jgi:hypothetical protein
MEGKLRSVVKHSITTHYCIYILHITKAKNITNDVEIPRNFFLIPEIVKEDKSSTIAVMLVCNPHLKHTLFLSQYEMNEGDLEN